MTLITKFRKDISTLRAAANREIYLDVKSGERLLIFKSEPEDDDEDDDGIMVVR